MKNRHDENRYGAVGFDLFNTLVIANADTLDEAMSRLVGHLKHSGFEMEPQAFHEHYGEAAASHIERSRKNGRETHNRFWICDALNRLGNRLSPDDPRISDAVESYFSAFYPNVRLIPGTGAMLEKLRGRFPLGLLSNFTHAPAAWKILTGLDIGRYFTTVVISGETGYRKPHPSVFSALAEGLSEKKERILFVGDDPETDVKGALQSGLSPVWMTYARDRRLPFTSGIFSENGENPSDKVPRISSWEALEALLEAVISAGDPSA